MEAVRRRRTQVEDTNMTAVANNIESRIQKSRKLQTTVYRSPEAKAPPAPAVAPKPAEKQEPLKAINDRASTISTNSSTDFMAMAERARLEYLEKQRKGEGEGETTLKHQAPTPPAPVSNGSAVKPSDSPSSAGLGDLATVIARKASQMDHTTAIDRISSQPAGVRILGSGSKPSPQSNGRPSSHLHNGHSLNVDDLVVPPPPTFDSGDDAVIVAPPPLAFEEDDFIPPPMGFEEPINAHRPFQDKPVETWQVSDVRDWLNSLQLSDHSARFVNSCVNGQRLIQLGYSELIDLGVRQVDDRMTIQRAIKQALASH
jgi:hypothetical protein